MNHHHGDDGGSSADRCRSERGKLVCHDPVIGAPKADSEAIVKESLAVIVSFSLALA